MQSFGTKEIKASSAEGLGLDLGPSLGFRVASTAVDKVQ